VCTLWSTSKPAGCCMLSFTPTSMPKLSVNRQGFSVNVMSSILHGAAIALQKLPPHYQRNTGGIGWRAKRRWPWPCRFLGLRCCRIHKSTCTLVCTGKQYQVTTDRSIQTALECQGDTVLSRRGHVLARCSGSLYQSLSTCETRVAA